MFIIMTTSTKFNSKELLSRLAESNSSGCLELDGGSISWKIYLYQGNLQYINCSAQSLDQLKYYLHYLKYKPAVAALKTFPSSNLKGQSSIPEKHPQQDLYCRVISWLIKEKHLGQSQVFQLIEYITQDLLIPCLWLDRGNSLWHEGYSLPLWIKTQFKLTPSLEIAKCLDEEQSRLKQWQHCSAKFISVYQRPYFAPGWETKSLPTSGSLNNQTLKELSKLLMGRTSIRQVSILLRKDELDVARILSPYIDNQIIYLHHAPSPFDKLPSIPRPKINVQHSSSLTRSNNSKNPNNSTIKSWKIVCIDDSPTILKEMQRFLDQNKFKLTTIDDPVEAVSTIFRINPDLILLDITMPKINGYKLCSLLRNSGNCDKTPIIMVTGNTGLIDKARAKIAGATDYFTKPFTQQGLMTIVEKHLG